jgi:ABC-type molybdate transport system substrate-binding protein
LPRYRRFVKVKIALFLAAYTATPLDLLTNHFDLVTTYNNSLTPPPYIFNYAQGILALLSNTPNVDLSCETGTCGYDPSIFSTVAIADPSLAPYGVAAQTVLTGRYGLIPPLSSNSLVHEYPNITATFNAVIARTDPVGFVAMSAICSNGSFPTPGNGTSSLAYFTIKVVLLHHQFSSKITIRLLKLVLRLKLLMVVHRPRIPN